MRFQTFNVRERQLLAEAVWRRQRCFIAGDKQFNDFGKLLDEVLEGMDYIPGKVV